MPMTAHRAIANEMVSSGGTLGSEQGDEERRPSPKGQVSLCHVIFGRCRCSRCHQLPTIHFPFQGRGRGGRSRIGCARWEENDRQLRDRPVSERYVRHISLLRCNQPPVLRSSLLRRMDQLPTIRFPFRGAEADVRESAARGGKKTISNCAGPTRFREHVIGRS